MPHVLILVRLCLTGILSFDGLCEVNTYDSCEALMEANYTEDGTYTLNLPSSGITMVYCLLDRSVHGGGWVTHCFIIIYF